MRAPVNAHGERLASIHRLASFQRLASTQRLASIQRLASTQRLELQKIENSGDFFPIFPDFSRFFL